MEAGQDTGLDIKVFDGDTQSGTCVSINGSFAGGNWHWVECTSAKGDKIQIT